MSLPAKEQHPALEDVRSARPYLLRRSPLETLARRVASIVVLAVLDITGLTIGLYLALVLRSIVRDPPPILWNLLWDAEADWLPFLTLLTLLVFWRNHLYGPRELREGAGRVVQSVALVTALALAFAIGTSQHFTTFGLYFVAAIAVATMISLLRWSYETFTGSMMRSLGVRRRVLLVGDEGQVAHLRATARREPRRHRLRVRRARRGRGRGRRRDDPRRPARRADRRRRRPQRVGAARDRRCRPPARASR